MDIKASELLDYWTKKKGYNARIRNVSDEQERALRLLLFLRFLEDNAAKFNLEFGEKEHLMDVGRAYGTPFFTHEMFVKHVRQVVSSLGMDPDAFEGYVDALSQSTIQEVFQAFDLKPGTFDLARHPKSGDTIIWGLRRLGHADKELGRISYYWDGVFVTRLLVTLLGRRDGARIFDPLCGKGGFFAMITEAPGKLEHLRFYGTDIYAPSIAQASMMLLFDGYTGPFAFTVGDALDEHTSFEDAPYDGIVCEPGVELLRESCNMQALDESSESERLDGRFQIVDREQGAILQAANNLAPGGVAVILLSARPGFSRTTARLRRHLVECGLMDACIELPKSLLDSRDDTQCVWVLRRARKDEDKGADDKRGILLLNLDGDGAKEGLKSAATNTDEAFDTDLATLANSSVSDLRREQACYVWWITDAVASRRKIPFASMVVSRADVLATEDASLRYSTYGSLIDMDTKMATAPSIEKLTERREILLEQLSAAEDGFSRLLSE